MLRRPQVFIVCSTEGLKWAEAIFSAIEHATEPCIWTHDVFRPMESALDALERVAENSDYGIALFSPDDLRVMRGVSSGTPRDNVIFELGLLVGRLTRERIFIIEPRIDAPSVPSDLLGITRLQYTVRDDGNYLAAVATAARRILSHIEEGMKAVSPSSVRFWNDVQARHRSKLDLRSLVENATRQIFMSGISLKYPVAFAGRQLREAICRGVSLEVLIPAIGLVADGVYDPYKTHAKEEVELAQRRWCEFAETLTKSELQCLSVTTTSLVLMHSIGIYDSYMYVNPFCAGAASSELPSFRIDSSFPAYRTFIRDALTHVSNGQRLCGELPGSSLSSLTANGGLADE